MDFTMEKIRKDYTRGRAAIAVDALRANRMESYCFEDCEELCAFLLTRIEKEKKVGFGNSLSIEQTGIKQLLAERGQPTIDPFAGGEINAALMRNVFEAHYYLTGVNAVTLDGKLLSVDSTGNRVAPMIFGPPEVLVIAGVNKLVRDLEEGRCRIKEIAAPLNARRLQKGTPCTVKAGCINCASETRICNAEVILHKKPYRTALCVLIVNQELGL